MRRDVLAWLAVIAVAAIITHACGYAFGVANQATYLLEPLHRAHPELLSSDWLVSNTTEYHSVFAAAAAYLFRWDDTGAVSFAVVHVVLMMALVVALYMLVTGSTRRSALPIFVLLAGWLMLNGERSLAGSYLWAGYLQPSLISTLAWVAALALHVRGRPLATGIALALGGLFHANFLILSIGMFGLSELIVDREGRLRRLALLVAPQLVALVVLLPELFAHATGADPDRALWVLVKFHAPVHYNPHSIVRMLPGLLRWSALAIVVAPVAGEFGQPVAVRRLVYWSAIAALLCTFACGVTLIPPLLSLTRLYVWRLAPFSILAAQVVIALSIAATLQDPAIWRTQPAWRRWLALAVALSIAVRLPFTLAASGDWVIWAMFVAIALAFVVPSTLRPALLPTVAIASLAVPLAYRAHDIIDPQTGVASEGPAVDGLYAWARATSPTDAVFMTPPTLYRFRLIARRAIVADFKSPPLAPDGLVEWHRRLSRMVGVTSVANVPEARTLWAASTGDQLMARAHELGADYLVVEHSPTHDQLAATPVFDNAELAVYATK